MKVFVGCSSRDEIPKSFLELALQVGQILDKHEVIIGGTRCGMMGRVVDEKSKTPQIILKDYLDGMDIKPNYVVCESSFERLHMIWKTADIFLFLPGGTGTLGEILTFLEENRMQREKKKILVFNYQDYYQDIIKFVEKAKELQFCNADILEGVQFVNDVEELKEFFN